MTTPYYQDEQTTLWHGDAAATLARLDAGSIDCIVTSPPYFGLRDYGVDGQIGAETSPAAFVASRAALSSTRSPARARPGWRPRSTGASTSAST